MTYDGAPDGYLDRLERVATATAGRGARRRAEWLDAPHYTLVVSPVPGAAAGADDASIAPCCRRSATPPDVTFPAVQRATLVNGLERDAARAASSAARQRGARGRRRLRGRLAPSAPAPPRSRSTCSTTARRRATRSAIADELDALGAQHRDRQLARSVVRPAAGAVARNLAPSLDDLRRRRAAPVVPAGHGGARRSSGGSRRSRRRRRSRCRRRSAWCRRCCSAPATRTATRSPARATSSTVAAHHARRSRRRGIATGSTRTTRR